MSMVFLLFIREAMIFLMFFQNSVCFFTFFLKGSKGNFSADRGEGVFFQKEGFDGKKIKK